MAASPEQSIVHAPASTPATGAEVLRLSLSCPKCGVTGWVKWTSLARGIHCPKCRCEFLIAKNGQIASYRDMPQTRYSCPRCGKSGSLPTQLAVRKAECVDCKLPLVAGPDHQLHGVKEAAELKRTADAKVRNLSYRDWLKANLRRSDGRIDRWRAVALVCVFSAGVTTAVAAARAWFDDSPETRVRRFTQACLVDRSSGQHYLAADDDVERIEFERWWLRHFASVERKHRPRGDRVAVAVESLDDGFPLRKFRLRMTSEFLGTRTLEEVWRLADNGWVFDASATLLAQDGPRLPARGQTAPTPRAVAKPRMPR